jgi:hypothetical protein
LEKEKNKIETQLVRIILNKNVFFLDKWKTWLFYSFRRYK